MITANLPARDFDETERFYRLLGFETRYRGADWMIMAFEGSLIEFFPHPDLDAQTSWFSACLRLHDIDAQHTVWSKADLPDQGVPRLTAPFQLENAPRMFALVDPNGSLWRILEQEG